MPTSGMVVNLRSETMAGVNSRLALVAEAETSLGLLFLNVLCCHRVCIYANTIIVFNSGE